MGLLFKNNAETTLSSGINNSTTTVPVASAAVFPTPDANNVFFATIEEGNNIEVVKVTGISSNDLTVVRAQDNTSAAAFGSGSKIQIRLTAQVLDMGTASITDLDGDTKIQVEETADDDDIRFDTAGSERMKIDSTGDVSIGTRGTNPMGLSMVGTVLALTEQTNVASFQIDGNQASRIDMGSGPGTRQFVIYTDTANYSSLERKDAKPILFATDNTERFRLDAAGGITTGGLASAARTPLHVHRDSASDVQVHMTNSATGSTGSDGMTVFANTTAAGFWFREAGSMLFATNGTERMRIHSSGKVGIGSNDPDADGYSFAEDLVIKAGASASDGAGLSIQSNTRRYGVIAFGDSANDNEGEIWYDHQVNSFNMRTANVQRFQLDSSGNATFTGNVTAYGSISDERLKENIKVIENPIEKIKDLKGVTFTYKKDGQKSTGLIAQDLEKVLPEAVYTSETIADEREGEESEEHLAIRYGNTVGLLVEAIKEQQEQIETLTAKVKELEDK